MPRKRSKRYIENKKKITETKTLALNDAIKALKNNNKVKFDETLDIAVMLNKEKNKGEGLSRGYAQLPNGTEKKKTPKLPILFSIHIFRSRNRTDLAFSTIDS